MKDTTLELRRPSARIGGDITNAAPGSVQVRLGIDMIPVAYISMFPKSASAAETSLAPTNREIADILGEWQSYIFTDRSSPDVTIHMDDGAGGTLEMRGYVADPALVFGSGHVDAPTVVVHESAPLVGLNPAIYAAIGQEFLVSDDQIDETNVPLLISMVSRDMVEKWQTHKSSFSDPSPKEVMIRDKVAAVNDKLWPIWHQILANSSELDWPEIAKIDPYYRKNNINGWIYFMLRISQGNFMQTMLGIAQGFQGMFVPNLTPGMYGSLRRYDAAFTRNRKTLNIKPGTMQLNAGSRDLLPISHVLVMTTPKNWWLLESKDSNNNIPRPVVAGWPETPYAGAGLIRDDGPPWLNGDIEITKPEDLPEDRLDLDVYHRLKREADKKTIDEIATPMERICTAWARNIYFMESLRTATVSVQTPLDLKLEVGRVYTVMADGAALFKGLLTEVTHILATHPSPAAMSHLTFTHIQAGSFTLPNA